MDRHRAFAALVVAGVLAQCAAASPEAPCPMSAQQQVHFQSPQSQDFLEMVVTGDKPCYSSTLLLSIRAQDGRVLYAYAAPFKKHTAVQWDEFGRAEADELLGEMMADGVQTELSSKLPEWEPPAAFYDKHFEAIAVSRAEYTRLRGASQPVLTHRTHYEEWRKIVFDPKTRRSVVLLEGGV